MQASILIVSKDRKQELERTLRLLETLICLAEHEVLVFLDGCTDQSPLLKKTFPWVKWYDAQKSIGASAARNLLYAKATGTFLIGLDDDAHPLNADFIALTKAIFEDYPTVGILAFQEIKGVFKDDREALVYQKTIREEYFTNDFIGCGFAIKKIVYDATNGFPLWVDIYGEESCVSIEVLSKGFDILYTNRIAVNHRVDRIARKMAGRNYFRFGKQLKNSTYYFLVYYPIPFANILKLYLHNFRKYALSDYKCFLIFFKTMWVVFLNLPKVLKHRMPVEKTVLDKMRALKGL